MSSLNALLAGLIDYAGLFPPASLPLEEAVRNYAAYKAGPHAFALGRFVVSASQLEELDRIATPHFPRLPESDPWRLTVLLGSDLAVGLPAIRKFNDRHQAWATTGKALVDTVELKSSTPAMIHDAKRLMPPAIETYFEIPIKENPGVLLEALKKAGAWAKVRTGGTTPADIPMTADLVRFISLAARHNVPFKATAGLHHAIRAVYPLTDEPGAPTATMFGFLNVFLVASFMHSGGATLTDSAALLEETDVSAIRFNEKGVRWRLFRLSLEQLEATRARFALAFGSCSFEEPIHELQAAGLI